MRRKKGEKKASLSQRVFALFQSLLRLAWQNKLLTFFFFLGLFLRLWGTNPGYPQLHSDEPSIQNATRILVVYHNYDPQNYYYGSLLPIIYAAASLSIAMPLFFIILLIKDWHVVGERGFFGFLDYYFYIIENGSTYWDTFYNFFPYVTRYETAILSSFVTILAFILGVKLFNKSVGLVAAFLTAVNYRHVYSSTFTLADAPTAVFALLSTNLSARLLKNQTTKAYVWAGVGIGLALSVKYFIYILPVFVICHIVGQWRTKHAVVTNIRSVILSKNAFFALLIAGTIFILINPYLFLNHEEAQRQLDINAIRYRLDAATILPKFIPPFETLVAPTVLFPFWYLFHFGFGWLLSLAIVAGSIIAFLKYTRSAILLLSVTAPYTVLFTVISGNAPVRNFAPIAPFLILFAAVLIVALSHITSTEKHRRFVLVVFTIVIGFTSFKDSILSSMFSSQPTNYVASFQWMNEHLPDNATIAKTPGAMVQKEHTGFPILPYFNGLGMSIDELQEKRADFAIISSGETSLANMLTLSAHQDLIAQSFLSEKRVFHALENTYISLVLNEISIYTEAIFVKPYWQSLEPALMIVRIPAFWTSQQGERVWEERFDQMKKTYSVTSPLRGDEIGRIETRDAAMVLQESSCNEGAAIVIAAVSVHPKRWYYLSGDAKRMVSPTYHQYGNGFFRLNFHASDHTLLQTYVSRLALEHDSWETFTAAGLSPKNATYATLVYQIDHCYRDEAFSIDNVTLNVADNDFSSSVSGEIDFTKKLPRNFIWLPEIV